LKYIEIKNQDITPKIFADYLKVLYCGFKSDIDDKLNVAGLFACALEFRDNTLVNMMASTGSFSDDSVVEIWKICKERDLKPIQLAAEQYIIDHFESLVRNKGLKNWCKTLIKTLTNLLSEKNFSEWCVFASWLDILWFSNQTENKDLQKLAVTKLQKLINCDNVVSILVGAHTAGEKELRSSCVDFIMKQGVSISQYQVMRENKEKDLAKIGSLSQSLRSEVEGKVKKTVKELHSTQQSNSKVGFLAKKSKLVLYVNELWRKHSYQNKNCHRSLVQK